MPAISILDPGCVQSTGRGGRAAGVLAAHPRPGRPKCALYTPGVREVHVPNKFDGPVDVAVAFEFEFRQSHLGCRHVRRDRQQLVSKTTGGSASSWLQMLDLLHADFRDSVVAERSQAPNPLKLSPEEVATGEIWVGVEAKEFGLIDELGSRLDAIERTAELANLTNYDVVNVRDEYLASLTGGGLTSALELYEELEAQPEFDLTSEETEWPTFYQLYIPLE